MYISPPCQHASNGMADNLIRFGKSRTRTLLFGSKSEANYWPYAMRMAAQDEAQIKSLEPRGIIGKLLQVNLWGGHTCLVLMPEGKVSRGLRPKRVEQAIRDADSPMKDEEYSQPGWLDLEHVQLLWSKLEDPTGKTLWVRSLDRAVFYDSSYFTHLQDEEEGGESLEVESEEEIESAISPETYATLSAELEEEEAPDQNQRER
eukprot:5911458-Amphidinium_carterae.1